MFHLLNQKKKKIDLTKIGLKLKEKIYEMGITIIGDTVTNQSNFEVISWN